MDITIIQAPIAPGFLTQDPIKMVILISLYFIVAPAAALLLARHRDLQRLAFAAMCFTTIGGWLETGEWGFTLAFDETYRGHSRGYHFLFTEPIALALLLSEAIKAKHFRWLPPGLWLYLLYCGLSLLSIVNAPALGYTAMAAVKAIKASVVFVAAYNFLHTEDDVRFFLKVMVVTIVWEGIVVTKLKYMDGMHQVKGTFEHQNALAMYAVLIGMVFLATGAAATDRQANWYFFAFLVTALIVVFTLSRGGMVVFAFGTAAVMTVILVTRLTRRRVALVCVLAVVGVAGVAKTMDSIVERFSDPYTSDSKMTRNMLKHASLLMVKDHPLGIGWNNYGVVINRPYRYGDHIDDYFLSHSEKIDPYHKKGIEESLYYLTLAETGIQGYVSLLVLLAVFLWWSIRSAIFYRHRFLGAVSLGIAAGCSMNYVQSLLERVLMQPRNLMLWLILLAVTARIEIWRRAERKAQRRGAAARRLEPLADTSLPAVSSSPAASAAAPLQEH